MFFSVGRFLHTSYPIFFTLSLHFITNKWSVDWVLVTCRYYGEHGGTVEPAMTISFMPSLPFQQGLNFYIALLKVSFAKTPFSHQQV